MTTEPSSLPHPNPPTELPPSLYTFYKPPIFAASPTFPSYIRLTAHDLHHSLHRSYPYHLPPDIYFFTNHPLRCVTITGLVIARDDWERRTALVIDDSSGELLDVIIPAAQLPDATRIRELATVEVKGTIDEFRGRRQMMLRAIRRVDAMEEVEGWEAMVEFKKKVLLRPWVVPEDVVERMMKEHRRERRREQRRREREQEEMLKEMTAGGWGVTELELDPSPPLRRRRPPGEHNKMEDEPLVLDRSPSRKRRSTRNSGRPRPVTPPPVMKEELVLDRTPPKGQKRTGQGTEASPVRIKEDLVLDPSPPRIHRRSMAPGGSSRHNTPLPVVKEEQPSKITPLKNGRLEERPASPVLIREETEEVILDKTPPRSTPRRRLAAPTASRKRPASSAVQLEQEERITKRIREKPPDDIQEKLGYEIDPADLSIILDPSPPRIRSHTQRIQQTQSQASPKLPLPLHSERSAQPDRSQSSRIQIISSIPDPTPPPTRSAARPTTPTAIPDAVSLDLSPPHRTSSSSRTQPTNSRTQPISRALSSSSAARPASTAPLPQKKPSLCTLKPLIIDHLHSSHYTYITLQSLTSTPAITSHAALIPGDMPRLIQKALSELAADGYLLPESPEKWIVVGAQSLKDILQEAAKEGLVEVGKVWRTAKAKGGVWAGVGKEVVREAVVGWVRGRKGWRERGRGEWVKV